MDCRPSAVEPLALIAPLGLGLELAQWSGSAQGHGGAHLVAQTPAAGIGGVASAPASAGQSDALRGPSPSGVGEQSDSVFTGGTWLSGGEGNQFPGIGARPLRRWAATVSLS